MAHCDICRGTFEIIATCSSGLTLCLPCWRHDVDECVPPLTVVDHVVGIQVLGEANGPDGEVHGHLSPNEYSEHELTDVDVSDVDSTDAFSDTDHEPGMMVCEPDVEPEPNVPLPEPEGEDCLWSLLPPSVGSPVIVCDSPDMTSDTELMQGVAGESDDCSVHMGSDTELVPVIAGESVEADMSDESGCESPSLKRQRLV
jgi:hypothetical protein